MESAAELAIKAPPELRWGPSRAPVAEGEPSAHADGGTVGTGSRGPGEMDGPRHS